MINYFNCMEHIDANCVTYIKEHIIIRCGNTCKNLEHPLLEELTALYEMGPDQLIHSRLLLKSGTESSAAFEDDLRHGIEFLEEILAAGKPLEIQADYLIDENVVFPGDMLRSMTGRTLDPEDYFFSFYCTQPDTEEDPEMMLAYGTMNHKTYTGRLPYISRSVPEEHVWSCVWPSVICEAENVDADKHTQLEELANNLSRFSRSNQMECENGSFCFQMDATELHSEQELLDFLGQAQKMQDLTDQIPGASCCYMVAFTDITGADPVSLIADISTDGSCQVRVTDL